ncbi:LOW QUALITY PROTEIN: TBCC domain-containing protein 1-like [Phoenix dactylifera]|uniref:TBCC domain-containing protein 1 n=1 Tax=Phoenix dactylifera TaxID=42345 RepID=A0A8B8ZR56_PHODC|nr:LOW QUALITY PROTEIN: TBCC domain-containing protein 1-like [Phoenix dactylifera]
MGDERPDPSTPTIPPPPSASAAGAPLLLRPRREPFEYGLLPIPKLIFSDGTLTLGTLRDKLLGLSSPCPGSVDALALAEALQISPDLARLVLDTLASVLPSGTQDPAGTADVYDLVLFLYIQSYKRLLPKAHKDSAAVADVWPSTSAFDGYFSALLPIQLVRSNSRRSMHSQADEEAHQLSYLQKHMANILNLLAESVEGEGDESMVLTLERFEHLGFLIQICEKGGEEIPLRQAPPFFANSDPDMPAVPVSAVQVHDWLLQNIAASLEHTAEKVPVKENGPVNTSDLDVSMTDACMSHARTQSSSSLLSGTTVHNNATYSRSQSFVEGFSKASVVKQACDIKGHSVKVLNCHDSVIYVLSPLKYATVYGCSDTTIVLGAIGKAVRVEHCERVQVITAAKRICIANCRECVFFLGVNQQPLILGDNHKLQVAPYNTFYSQLEEHMAQVGIDATINRWNEPLVLGMVDPHDSLSHPAGVSDVQAESATCLDPDQFSDFLIPKWFGVESPGSTKYNPFPLPEIYKASEKKNNSIVCDIQQAIRDAQLEESRKREMACAVHVHFKDWLYASGNIRQLYCLQGD